MKKIAILGASYLQKPLVEKAKEMGLETHVFAWRDGNQVEHISDYYYDISILDKDMILQKCKAIKIDGITSIASDIAMPTVNYVAHQLGLNGNSLESTQLSTDKFKMRKALQNAKIPCPKFELIKDLKNIDVDSYNYPVIVKPTDRSGSRGVAKVIRPEDLVRAIESALQESIHKRVIIEEFMEGREFSIESISYEGNHKVLAITDKETTGAPHFVEIAHHQPANITDATKKLIIQETLRALDVLKIRNGASHTELFLTKAGDLRIIEVAGRMGGDFIGSTLTMLSTGIDALEGVIKIALHIAPNLQPIYHRYKTGILFKTKITEERFEKALRNDATIFSYELFNEEMNVNLKSSNQRSGYLIYKR